MRDFRAANIAAAAARRTHGDLHRASMAIEGYDEREGLPRSHLWPDRSGAAGSSEEPRQARAARGAAAAGESGAEGLGGGAAGHDSGRGAESSAEAAQCSDDDDDDDDEPPERAVSPVSAARERWLALPGDERLSQAIAHLRDRHRHCLYCGCQARAAASMIAPAPLHLLFCLLSRSCHFLVQCITHPPARSLPRRQLPLLLLPAQYESAQALAAECPGPTAADHDDG